MKKRIFKFGAALTAALMICSATAGLAFADEVEEAAPEAAAPVVEETVDEAAEDAVEEEAPAEDVEAPVEDAEDVEAPAEDAEGVEEVAVPLDTKDITAEDIAEAAADDPNYNADSEIEIGDITVASADANYYDVTVPITMKDGKALPAQVTLFVYDITQILNGGAPYGYVETGDTTPVGYIDQKASAADFKFKLAKAKFPEGNVMIAKVGGTDINAADAKSFKLESSGEGPTPEVTYGDVNSDGKYNADDALLVLKFGGGKGDLTAEQQKAADVNVDGKYNADDVLLILKYGGGKLDKFPAEQ